ALTWVDGVMLGREAYHRPMVLAELDAVLHAKAASSSAAAGVSAPPREATLNRESLLDREALPDREALLDRMAHYASRELARGERLSSITRHMLGLYAGEPGAREYRRTLSEGARVSGASPDLIRRSAPARNEENTRIGL